MEKLGEMMRRLRHYDKQKDFAKRTGFSNAYISDVENGNRGLSGEAATKVSKALKLSKKASHELQLASARYAGFKL